MPILEKAKATLEVIKSMNGLFVLLDDKGNYVSFCTMSAMENEVFERFMAGEECFQQFTWSVDCADWLARCSFTEDAR